MNTKTIQAALTTLKAALMQTGATVTLDQVEMALAANATAPDKARERASATVSTEVQVKSRRPGVYRVAGVKRLYLKKTSRSTGSYFLRYRIDGKRPEMGLGSIAEITLMKAREMAEELGVKLTRKVDLIAERDAGLAAALKAVENEKAKASEPTVEEAIMAYLDANAPSWRHPYARMNWLNPIRTHAFPVIGRLKVNAVQPLHILMVMKAMDEKGVSGLARKVRPRLKTMFNYLAAHGLRDATLSNPADARLINAGRPKTETKTEHHRRIDVDAAPDAFTKLMARADGDASVSAWLFMALTAARPSEALAARWDQIDLAKRLWTNPSSKTGNPLAVPLSDLAMSLLDMQSKTGDLIFPNRSGSKLSPSTLAAAPKRVGVEAGAPHSWRSIFRDWCGDIGRVDRDLAEAALGHSLSAVEKAYRRQTAVEARRAVMEAYANWLMGEVANVIAFKSRA
jgi:integrase